MLNLLSNYGILPALLDHSNRTGILYLSAATASNAYSESQLFLQNIEACMLTVEATAHWFRSGHECGQLTVTTASAKKRKLGKRDEAHHDCRERPHLASSGVSQGCSSLVPPSQRPLAERTGVNSLSCTPPSRCLPSHIQSEILERQGRSLFETSDNISTAASSPSAAYAGLTLDEESGANMTGGDLDRDGDLSLGSPPIAAGSPYVPSGGSLINGDSIPERSSSPAIKRPASELDDEADAVSRVAVSNGEGSSLKTVSMLRFDQGQSDFDRAVGLARRPARHTARYHDSSTVEESKLACEVSGIAPIEVVPLHNGYISICIGGKNVDKACANFNS